MNDASLRRVVAVARDVLQELDLDTVLRRVVEAACEVTGARYGALGVMNESRSGLERFITTGLDEAERRAIGAPPTGRGVLGELIAHPATLRLKDIGAHPHSYGFPIGHPPMRSFLGAPITIGGKAFGNFYLTDKVGSDEFSSDDEEAVELLAGFAALAIDHAQRYTIADVDRQGLRQTVAALDATLQIGRALSGETDLDAILELVAKRGRALVAARALVIEHLRGSAFVIAAAAGDVPQDLIGEELERDDSVASAALRTLSTQRIEDGSNRLRFDQHGLGRLGFEARAGLVVPLMFRGRAYGALVAVDRLESGPAFSDQDRTLLEAFAASAAAAVATAESVAEERNRQRLAASEEERRRWARELHDETLQSLASLRLRLSSARRVGTLDALDEATADVLEQIGREIANLRALITELRPAALDELGPEAAIEALAERARERGLEVDAVVELGEAADGAPARHPVELETAIYRITQEALTNAQKHGHAQRASVEIREEPGRVRIVVRDDGAGFDPADHTEGFGLVGMQERADLFGGTVDIRSAPGSGTELTVELPLDRRAAPASADVG